MSVVIYGETKEQVKVQKACSHKNWQGPCMDAISRYFKCLDCFCLERDLTKKQAKKHYKSKYIKKRKYE